MRHALKKIKAIRQAKNDLYSDFATIKKALNTTTRDLKKNLGGIYEESLMNVKERSSDATQSFADYITKKPIKSVVISTVTGFVLGFLFRK